jgi:hypothetical protein
MSPKRFCALDLETENVCQKDRTHGRFQHLRIAWICVSDPATGRIRHFRKERMAEAIEAMRGRVVVGWGIDAHDLPLLAVQYGQALPIVGTLDLCAACHEACGLWLSLEDVTAHTLGYKRDIAGSVPSMIRALGSGCLAL